MEKQMSITNPIDYKQPNKRTFKAIKILLNHIFKYEKQATNIKVNEPSLFRRKKDIIPKIELLIDILQVDEDILVTALYYIDQLTEIGHFYITRSNIYNLFMTAIIISIKMYADNKYELGIYCSLFETRLQDVIDMEREFLSMIDYKLYIEEEQYNNYKCRLLKVLRHE